MIFSRIAGQRAAGACSSSAAVLTPHAQEEVATRQRGRGAGAGVKVKRIINVHLFSN